MKETVSAEVYLKEIKELIYKLAARRAPIRPCGQYSTLTVLHCPDSSLLRYVQQALIHDEQNLSEKSATNDVTA